MHTCSALYREIWTKHDGQECNSMKSNCMRWRRTFIYPFCESSYWLQQGRRPWKKETFTRLVYRYSEAIVISNNCKLLHPCISLLSFPISGSYHNYIHEVFHPDTIDSWTPVTNAKYSKLSFRKGTTKYAAQFSSSNENVTRIAKMKRRNNG